MHENQRVRRRVVFFQRHQGREDRILPLGTPGHQPHGASGDGTERLSEERQHSVKLCLIVGRHQEHVSNPGMLKKGAQSMEK
jgi:hypothetical protein